jgi:ElaB/YqjD/DUF883 family membrane-anchored ribosome-binding protein
LLGRPQAAHVKQWLRSGRKSIPVSSLRNLSRRFAFIPASFMRSKAMGSKSGKEIAEDLDTLRQDVSALADHLSGFLSDKGDEVMGDVKHKGQEVMGDMKQGVQKIRENAADVISQARGKSRALARDGFDGLGQMIEDSVQERPFIMLAIAAGLGAILATRLSR